MEEENTTFQTKKKPRGESRDFPLIKLEDALEVAKVVKELGEYATPQDIGNVLKLKGGGLARKIASTKRWNLINGSGELKLTDLAREIFYPTENNQPDKAKIKAFLGIELFRSVYERFKKVGQLPKDDILKNMLVINYHLNEKDAITVVNIVKKSVSTFIPLEKDIEEFKSEEETTIPVEETSDKRKLLVENHLDVNAIYSIAKNIGFLETLSKNSNKIGIEKEEISTILHNIRKYSAPFKSLNSLILLTIDETDSGEVNITAILKRVKFFSESFENDIGLSNKENGNVENKRENKNQ